MLLYCADVLQCFQSMSDTDKHKKQNQHRTQVRIKTNNPNRLRGKKIFFNTHFIFTVTLVKFVIAL